MNTKTAQEIYLDYAATTPVDTEVMEVMAPYFSRNFGNPSSLHGFGAQAKTAVENARAQVAGLINAKTSEIIFTSGGTESNNAAIKGTALAMRKKGNHIVTSSIEHSSVYEPCVFMKELGFDVTFVDVDREGMVDPEDVRRAITERTVLVSVMHGNNEFGTIQPIEEIGRIARERGVCFHVDMVQTFGHLPIDMSALNVDLASFSAHKFYGPKGVGGLYARTGTSIHPIILGGHQENGRRASTHNVPGIVGLGKAADLAGRQTDKEMRYLTELRGLFIEGLRVRLESVCFNGHPVKRLPGNVHISIPHAEGEAVVIRLAMEGIACSAGAACASGGSAHYRVLKALDLPLEFARGSLRFSMGRYTRPEEIDRVLEVLPSVLEKMVQRSRHTG
jgi:cysteine desulfurase